MAWAELELEEDPEKRSRLRDAVQQLLRNELVSGGSVLRAAPYRNLWSPRNPTKTSLCPMHRRGLETSRPLPSQRLPASHPPAAFQPQASLLPQTHPRTAPSR